MGGILRHLMNPNPSPKYNLARVQLGLYSSEAARVIQLAEQMEEYWREEERAPSLIEATPFTNWYELCEQHRQRSFQLIFLDQQKFCFVQKTEEGENILVPLPEPLPGYPSFKDVFDVCRYLSEQKECVVNEYPLLYLWGRGASQPANILLSRGIMGFFSTIDSLVQGTEKIIDEIRQKNVKQARDESFGNLRSQGDELSENIPEVGDRSVEDIQKARKEHFGEFLPERLR